MDGLPPYQGQSPKPNSVEASTLDDTAMSQGNAYGKTVSLFRGGPSGVSQADFTSDPAARKKDQKETEISSRGVAFGVNAFEAAERKPKLDFTDVTSIVPVYCQGIFKAEAHPGKKSEVSSRPTECRDICDISEDSIVGLINYHKYMVEPKDRLAGDVVTYAPLLSSEFDKVRSFLEDDLNLDPKDTVIIDAGSGPFCYHSALFAVAGFTVRPYDYSPARSLYCKEDHGVAEKNLSPFLKVNDKDLTGDDITPSFFDKNSVLFMSFPDLPGHPISLPLVKKYTESEALNKVVVLLIGIDDEHECNFGSVSKETMDFLKENYELRCNCPTRGVLLQSSLAQIYVKRGVNREDFTSGPVTRKNTNTAKDRMRKAFMELEKQNFGHAEGLFRELLSEGPLQLNDSIGRYGMAEARLLALRNKGPDADESAQCEPSGNFDYDLAQVKVWKLMHKYELAEKLQQNMIGKPTGDSEISPSQSADNDRPE